ncbi:MAG TPA: hypothetical protein VFK65_06125 [Candidatus Binatia bacterium]|nr:hypothetical protein [Candidatus Binatia bacterium]
MKEATVSVKFSSHIYRMAIDSASSGTELKQEPPTFDTDFHGMVDAN